MLRDFARESTVPYRITGRYRYFITIMLVSIYTAVRTAITQVIKIVWLARPSLSAPSALPAFTIRDGLASQTSDISIGTVESREFRLRNHA